MLSSLQVVGPLRAPRFLPVLVCFSPVPVIQHELSRMRSGFHFKMNKSYDEILQFPSCFVKSTLGVSDHLLRLVNHPSLRSYNHLV